MKKPITWPAGWCVSMFSIHVDYPLVIHGTNEGQPSCMNGIYPRLRWMGEVLFTAITGSCTPRYPHENKPKSPTSNIPPKKKTYRHNNKTYPIVLWLISSNIPLYHHNNEQPQYLELPVRCRKKPRTSLQPKLNFSAHHLNGRPPVLFSFFSRTKMKFGTLTGEWWIVNWYLYLYIYRNQIYQYVVVQAYYKISYTYVET